MADTRYLLVVSNGFELPLDVGVFLAPDRSVEVRFALSVSQEQESIARTLDDDPSPYVVDSMTVWRKERPR